MNLNNRLQSLRGVRGGDEGGDGNICVAVARLDPGPLSVLVPGQENV